MAINLVCKKIDQTPQSISANRFAKHTAILAQSGSGKSFLLGRLVEELTLKTQARIVVFDPNSDFIRLPQPDLEVWKDSKLKPWFFPDESADVFSSLWEKAPVLVASNHNNLANAKRLVLDWGSLSVSQMAAVMNIDPTRDSSLYWCLFLAWQISRETWDFDDEEYYDFDHFREQAERIEIFLSTGKGPKVIKENPLAQNLRRSIATHIPLRFRAMIDSLGNHQIWRSRGDGEKDVRELLPGSEDASRVLVVDLQSLDSEEQRIPVVSSLVDAIWDKAKSELWEVTRDFDKPDSRVQTFIIIDEAHNLIPAERNTPGIRRLAAQIVRIAAEGRKYGLQLIAVTQRPRKIDPNVLSECDNLILMKLTNASDLDYAERVFGFLPPSFKAQAKGLSVGDLLLGGQFAVADEVLHASPRRTIQGGRSIPDSTWTLSGGGTTK